MIFLKILIFLVGKLWTLRFPPFPLSNHMKDSSFSRAFLGKQQLSELAHQSSQGSLPYGLPSEPHPQYRNQTNTNKELPGLVVFEVNKLLCSRIFLPYSLNYTFLTLHSYPIQCKWTKPPVLKAGDSVIYLREIKHRTRALGMSLGRDQGNLWFPAGL